MTLLKRCVEAGESCVDAIEPFVRVGLCVSERFVDAVES
jgi:hypothetical protein